MNLIDKFRLGNEKEDFEKVNSNIENGIYFRGTNLWILIFAIFIASLGLNVNSTAVIIGAMLVSPLMGPIMGIGFGMAINDLSLLRKSVVSYLFAAAVGLATSTVYFSLSPVNDAHSEILARTSPNLYDVLIAFFGGLAGMLATSSKLKGNVIPGVAIATALMPPLCTAGYGLATLQFKFFFGAFYLFLINTVFIALSTLLTARFLKFPLKHLPKKADEAKAKRIVGFITMITLLPSIYLGYEMVQEKKFQQKVNRFIEKEAVFPNDYLLKKEIDAKNKSIILTYGGQAIEEEEITKLKKKLTQYYLEKASLQVRQGFAYLENNKEDERTSQLSLALNEKESQLMLLQKKADSVNRGNQLGKQIFNELKIQYPAVQSFALQKATSYSQDAEQATWFALVQLKGKLEKAEQLKMEAWIKVRMNINQINIYFQ